jgi:hypothetical protein
LATLEQIFDLFHKRHIDGVGSWNNDLHPFRRRGNHHASLSTCSVFSSHRINDEPWLLDIKSTSVAITGLCGRTECPSRCQDLAEPSHDRPVRWGSGLQVRVVLQPRWLSILTVLPADNPSSGRPRALIQAAIIGRFRTVAQMRLGADRTGRIFFGRAGTLVPCGA